MPVASGTFKVLSGGEDAYQEPEGAPRLTRAHGTQRFVGDIEGDGSVEWLMCYLPDGTARFVGHQRITGSLAGRNGSFVIEAVGVHDGTASRATWTVIDGSATGGLSRLRGEGGFQAPGGPEVSYSLDYRFG